jgi:hypothetical protein
MPVPHLGRLVDLDARPRSTWILRASEVYILEGSLARLQKVGCVLCVAEEDDLPEHQTLRLDTTPPRSVCVTHGSLEEVPWVTSRHYMVTVADETTTGTLLKQSIIYIPTSLTTDERAALIQELLGECHDLERAEGSWDEDFSPR